MSNSGSVEAAVVAGVAAADLDNRSKFYAPDILSEGVPVVLLNGDQRIEVMGDVLSVHDSRQTAPRRRTGTAFHSELESFISHVNRNKQPCTTVWADVGRVTLTCVFNYHPAGDDPADAGWGDHRAEYACPLSPEWCAWVNGSGAKMSQDEFAQFIEDHAEQIAGEEGFPSSVDLLMMARDLQVHTKGQFERKIDPVSGTFSMICKEEHSANSTKIPKAFVLGLRVFEGGDTYRVEARIQFRLTGGRPVFSYQLHRAAEIKLDAFNDLRDAVAEKTELVVFAGRP